MVDVFDPQHVFVESLRSAGYHDLAADYAGLIRRGVLFSSAPTVVDHSRTLPQRDGSARPALAGREEGGERDLIVLDASDVLHDAFAVRGPRIDAEGEVSSKRRGHLRLLLPDLLRTSRNSLGPLRSRRLRRCRSSSVADGSLRRSISWPAIAVVSRPCRCERQPGGRSARAALRSPLSQIYTMGTPSFFGRPAQLPETWRGGNLVLGIL